MVNKLNMISANHQHVHHQHQSHHEHVSVLMSAFSSKGIETVVAVWQPTAKSYRHFDLIFQDTSLRVKGLLIRAVVPDSPAARCGKLVPGDRILAVNGVSLLGLDYHG